ncbi:uncharacterized protein LOC123411616 isoform X2 [Hordeum vulgare subsp. vulgare]|uniref:uncharacterized protein LOC123411616 isoform X1 n=1 Tax=Hordeum vulgare subsp. vulgare TaxID=112509 RepID=UPI001D1A4857|nr:uncharacterized protein LOC123411616 isoform X1 [Hordeum vulgare subsp. vulgare]XP_044960517.1 uncharacterized protein LOC123411616 isoform X2 [Hordeum vulgare subsp. vulgare]XP_044960518.1 uncharacterized protein LOC123411616 isoform X2 [Hordeum vulgare subsp. vulgare]
MMMMMLSYYSKHSLCQCMRELQELQLWLMLLWQKLLQMTRIWHWLFKCLSRTHRGQSDMSKVFEDRSFVTSILNTLPGVDPNDPSVKDLLAYFAWPRRVRKWCLHLCLHLQIPLCSSLGERLMSPISVPLMCEAPSVLQA